jgi:hypothetical protein
VSRRVEIDIEAIKKKHSFYCLSNDEKLKVLHRFFEAMDSCSGDVKTGRRFLEDTRCTRLE